MSQKSKVWLFVYLLVIGSVLLNACSPLVKSQASSSSQLTPDIQYTDSLTGSVKTPQPASNHADSLERLLVIFKQAGIAEESVEQDTTTLLDNEEAFVLMVTGGEMHVYSFASSEDALAASQRISPDGTEIKSLDGSISSVRWIGTPYFWLSESFIIQYIGNDQATLSRLEQAFGKPFATTSPAESPAGRKNLWKEVRVERDNFGFAVPCWWEVGEMPADGMLRSLTMRSYDDAFFQAHSEKGEWKDGITPDGAYKVDITIAVIADLTLSTEEAYKSLLDPALSAVAGNSEIKLGQNTWMVLTLQNLVNSEDKPGNVYVNRLSQNELLIVSAYPWPSAIESSDIQAILGSFAFSSEQAIQLPTSEPHTPLVEAGCAR